VRGGSSEGILKLRETRRTDRGGAGGVSVVALYGELVGGATGKWEGTYTGRSVNSKVGSEIKELRNSPTEFSAEPERECGRKRKRRQLASHHWWGGIVYASSGTKKVVGALGGSTPERGEGKTSSSNCCGSVLIGTRRL